MNKSREHEKSLREAQGKFFWTTEHVARRSLPRPTLQQLWDRLGNETLSLSINPN
jgi:hypothetical protein